MAPMYCCKIDSTGRGHCVGFWRGASLRFGVRGRNVPTPLTMNPQGLTRTVTARTTRQVWGSRCAPFLAFCEHSPHKGWTFTVPGMR